MTAATLTALAVTVDPIIEDGALAFVVEVWGANPDAPMARELWADETLAELRGADLRAGRRSDWALPPVNAR